MSEPSAQPATPDRRTFLATASSVATAGGLLAAYGTLTIMAGKLLYPSRPARQAWLFVTEVERLKPGETLRYQVPSGQLVTIARREAGGAASDFLALSSICPHLGCRVHWEAQNDRFFCPCHNGVFNPEGKAISGPPAEAGQSLPQYALKVENGLLFIEVPLEGAA